MFIFCPQQTKTHANNIFCCKKSRLNLKASGGNIIFAENAYGLLLIASGARSQIGGDKIVVGGHCYQNLDWHILWELLARRRRRARVFVHQLL